MSLIGMGPSLGSMSEASSHHENPVELELRDEQRNMGVFFAGEIIKGRLTLDLDLSLIELVEVKLVGEIQWIPRNSKDNSGRKKVVLKDVVKIYDSKCGSNVWAGMRREVEFRLHRLPARIHPSLRGEEGSCLYQLSCTVLTDVDEMIVERWVTILPRVARTLLEQEVPITTSPPIASKEVKFLRHCMCMKFQDSLRCEFTCEPRDIAGGEVLEISGVVDARRTGERPQAVAHLYQCIVWGPYREKRRAECRQIADFDIPLIFNANCEERFQVTLCVPPCCPSVKEEWMSVSYRVTLLVYNKYLLSEPIQLEIPVKVCTQGRPSLILPHTLYQPDVGVPQVIGDSVHIPLYPYYTE